MFFGGYPITPASAILHHLSRLKEFGITTFQAEDEIAAVAASTGASYAGQLGVTSSSGPGIALKTEEIGLAIMTELPLAIVHSQRGGPARKRVVSGVRVSQSVELGGRRISTNKNQH